MSVNADSQWDSSSRVQASQRWRQPSSAMGRHLTEAIVAEARVSPGMRVLDVASGTGEPAISIATLLQGSGEVVATDVSANPLQVGEQRARQRGLANIHFLQADVHHLPFADSEFDRVTCRLGVMFFADPPCAFRQIHRVLKPAGRASMLAWGPMEQPYFDTTLGTILRLVPTLSLPPAGALMFRFGRKGALTAALRAAGFSQVEERFADLPWNWPDTPGQLWDYFREVTIPFKPLFEAVPAAHRAEVHASVLHALKARYDGAEVKFTARVVLASAIP